MAQYKLGIARFPYGGWERKELGSFWAELARKTAKDSRISEVFEMVYDDTPIPMLRNRAAKDFKNAGYDYLLMADDDVQPDVALGKRHDTRPFWESSWEFLMAHRDEPCVIAAPYVGPPPLENIYAFHWETRESQTKEFNWKLEQFSRAHALLMGGISEVAALATGLMLIDLRVFDRLPPENGRGWFYYQHDDLCVEKQSTEDVVFTRNLSLAYHASGGKAGGRVYCNWQAWAGHWKQKCCLPPEPAAIADVAESFRDVVLSGHKTSERLVVVGNKINPARPNVQANGAIAIPGREVDHAA